WFTQAGAGIVYDSVPENEWFETENKMKAMVGAILEETGSDQ
ncbi:chorismate-binding protein, partial [Methanopyrus sp.]